MPRYVEFMRFAFALNVAEWPALFFLVFNIEHYRSWNYNLIAWLGLFFPLFLCAYGLTFTAFSPLRLLRWLKRRRGRQAVRPQDQGAARPHDQEAARPQDQEAARLHEQEAAEPHNQEVARAHDQEAARPNEQRHPGGRHKGRGFSRAAAILTTTSTFILVLVYFYAVALPQYQQPQWISKTAVTTTMAAPGLAIWGDYNDAVYISFVEGVKCYFGRYSNDGHTSCLADINDKAQTVETSRYGQLSVYNFTLPSSYTLELNTLEILYQVNFTYNSEEIRKVYNTLNPQFPVIGFTLFDARLSPAQFWAAIESGILSKNDVPALGSTTLNIQAERTRDLYGMVNITNTDAADNVYTKLDPPYITYLYTVSSTGSANPGVCDVSPSGQYQEPCNAQFLIHIGDWLVPTLESKPGADPISILTAEGGITGAVMFFCWFLASLYDEDMDEDEEDHGDGGHNRAANGGHVQAGDGENLRLLDGAEPHAEIDLADEHHAAEEDHIAGAVHAPGRDAMQHVPVAEAGNVARPDNADGHEVPARQEMIELDDMRLLGRV